MSALDTLVSQLFRMPGATGAGTGTFLRSAARAHHALLLRAANECREVASGAGPLLSGIKTLLHHIESRAERDRLLLDPTFIEGLHAAADDSPSLARWHHQIADPGFVRGWPAGRVEGANHLGNTLLPLLLRDDPDWQGRVLLQSDLYGRLRFALCDWSIDSWSTVRSPGGVFSQECWTATLTRRDVRLALADRPGDDLLVMPRRDWLRMLIGNDDTLNGARIACSQGVVGLRFQFATRIPGWQVRFDPVRNHTDDSHAGLTGGIVAAAIDAIARHAPSVAEEFDELMSVVHGWELPPAEYGTLQSFSDPTLPRVMGINVSYTAEGEPQVCPCCFTWFGHELGHTKSYLIETILHVLGHSLTVHHGELTEFIPRYGRTLPVRALVQIPYTHLYEWIVMMRFMEGGFSALPWEVGGDTIGHAEDLRSEITEALERIDRDVELTAAGREIMSWLHGLHDEVLNHWRRVCGEVHGAFSG